MEKRLVIKQFIYLFTSQYSGLFVSIAGGIALTRLLDPSAFGIIAAFLFYLTSFNWISEFGWDQGFMVHTEIDLDTAAATHCMIRTVTGLIPVFTFICLKLLGIKFSFQEYFSVLFVLAISYFFEKISLTPKTILERNYQLSSCALLETAATVLSYGVALTCAYKGWGAMSLAMQRLTEKVILCVGYFYVSSWRYSIRGSLWVVKRFLITFGLATYLGSLVSLIIYDFMGWFVAWYVNIHDAGLYAKAFNLATFPLIFTAICSRSTIPLYTKYQNDVPAIRNIFIKMQLFKIFLLIPLQIGLVLTSWWWIPKGLGSQWLLLVPVYNVMAVYGLFRSFFDDVPNVLTYGFRNPWLLTQSQAIQASVIVVFGFMLIPRYQALGSAITMSVSMAIATIYLWYHVLKKLSCTKATFYGATRDYWYMIKNAKEWYAEQ
ncbi:oligosaccharide flippase family protein [Candidatus Babeliales bacterium]|nr:oligosaccharide flippase family protein [Candidatus Babeliales bacterium]